MLLLNKPLWLDVESHVTNFNQSERNAILKFVYGIGSSVQISLFRAEATLWLSADPFILLQFNLGEVIIINFGESLMLLLMQQWQLHNLVWNKSLRHTRFCPLNEWSFWRTKFWYNGREPWSSCYGGQLMFKRCWVWILARYTGWTWHFFTMIFCKKLFERIESKRKRGRGWPFLKLFDTTTYKTDDKKWMMTLLCCWLQLWLWLFMCEPMRALFEDEWVCVCVMVYPLDKRD